MYNYLLWCLKIGIVTNLFLFFKTLSEPFSSVDVYLLAPAQLLFLISAYRCLFPNNYSKKIVLHDTFFSSIKINAGKEKIINKIATDLKISI